MRHLSFGRRQCEAGESDLTSSADLTGMFKSHDIQYEYNARKMIFQRGKMKLYHYAPIIKNPQATPTLIVFAMINRPEILDLFPERSFIRCLLDEGVDVYLLDWGYPDADDIQNDFGYYITSPLRDGVRFILETSKVKKINLVGVCQGGVMSICYSLLFDDVKNLVLISTPIDFQTKENTIYHVIKNIDIDVLVNTGENIPGVWLKHFFISLRPFELVGKKYLHFTEQVENTAYVDKFLRIEKWLHDAPDQTKASLLEFIERFYLGNQLVNGGLKMGGRQIGLHGLTLPILNIIAQDDEIIPPSASRDLKKYIGSKDYQQQEFASGHIGIFVSDRVGKSLPEMIALWLQKRG